MEGKALVGTENIAQRDRMLCKPTIDDKSRSYHIEPQKSLNPKTWRTIVLEKEMPVKAISTVWKIKKLVVVQKPSRISHGHRKLPDPGKWVAIALQNKIAMRGLTKVCTPERSKYTFCIS